MERRSRVDPRITGTLAALGVVGLLVALVSIGGTNLLTVTLALLGVLLAMVAGVCLAAVRENGAGQTRRTAARPVPAPRNPAAPPARHIDADTLDAFEPLRHHRPLREQRPER